MKPTKEQLRNELEKIEREIRTLSQRKYYLKQQLGIRTKRYAYAK